MEEKKEGEPEGEPLKLPTEVSEIDLETEDDEATPATFRESEVVIDPILALTPEDPDLSVSNEVDVCEFDSPEYLAREEDRRVQIFFSRRGPCRDRVTVYWKVPRDGVQNKYSSLGVS